MGKSPQRNCLRTLTPAHYRGVMSDDEARDEPQPDDEALREAFESFLSGGESFDPAEFLKAAGINVDAAEIQKMMGQLQAAFTGGFSSSPTASRDHAVSVAKEGMQSLDPATSQAISDAAHVATLWLSEVTDIADLPLAPLVGTRAEWARKSLPVWEEIAKPVAVAIPRALSGMMSTQAPEELAEALSQIAGPMEQVSQSLFTMQLASVVGKLATEVLSGGDIGIPLIHGESEYDVRAMLIAQNMRAFSQDLDIPVKEADIFLAVREIAHARLFRHARWLRLHLMSTIHDFASGISIDGDRIMDLAEDFDPANPEAITEMLASGALLPSRSAEQERALERLETMLALIEGWVDHLTHQATQRLPKSDALAEAIRRRRASGGPAERAFSTLVGLELRPRRLREASVLWAKLTQALGPQARDALWQHPDTVPTDGDIDDPNAFIARLQNPTSELDEMDQALNELLDDESTT
jgi:putative hydrolase